MDAKSSAFSPHLEETDREIPELQMGFMPLPVVPDHTVPSLLTMIFCCLPIGLVALILSVQANSTKYRDVSEARRKAKAAGILNLVALACGLVLNSLYVYYFVSRGVVVGEYQDFAFQSSPNETVSLFYLSLT